MSSTRDNSSSSRPTGSRPRRRSSKSTGSSISSPPPSIASSTNNNNRTDNKAAMMMMIEEPESCLPRVFNLQKYQVVLGRYNRCTKTKALTPAVKLYKRVRDQLERGENQSQLPQIKQRIGKLLQEELGYPEPPPVTFWVDVHKAEKDGKLDQFMETNPQLRRCKDHDGEEVVFVQDHDDYFLKADLAGHKKRRSKTNLNNEKATTNKKTKQTKSLKAIMEDHKNRKSSYAARDAATRRSSVTSVTSRTVSTMGSGSINSGGGGGGGGASVHTGASSSMSRPSSAMGSSVISSSTSSTAAMSATAPLFQLTPGCGWLDDEVDRISCEWILQDGPTSSLDIITRKTNLVQTFKSYVAYFRRLLQRNDPCRASPDIALQRMNEGVLVQVVNVLGNSMVDWYNKYPSSCLAGETNAWNEELGDIEQEQPAVPVPAGTAASDIDSKASIGTYEVSSQEDKELEDASRRLSEFDISGGADWIIPGDIGNNNNNDDDNEEDVTQEDEFDEDDDEEEEEDEEFTQTASSEMDEEEFASPNYKEQHLLREWSPYSNNNAEESEEMVASPAKPNNGREAAVLGDFLLDAESNSNNNNKSTSKKGSSSRSSSSRGVRGWTKRPSLSKYSRVKSPIVDEEEE